MARHLLLFPAERQRKQGPGYVAGAAGTPTLSAPGAAELETALAADADALTPHGRRGADSPTACGGRYSCIISGNI